MSRRSVGSSSAAAPGASRVARTGWTTLAIVAMASSLGAQGPSDPGVATTDAIVRCYRPATRDVPRLEGYGTSSAFGGGAGFEVCRVTSLEDAGAGTLRECVEARNGPTQDPVPRTIAFDVAGTITLLSDLRVRQPHLTIDGFTAPPPGITLNKQGDGEDGGIVVNTWPNEGTCGRDVLIQGIRLEGVWEGDSEDHSNNAGTFGLDGEDLTGCLENVVINRVTILRGQDGAGDIWGSARNVTYQFSAFFWNLHPSSISHSPGGDLEQARENVSLHHNVFAYSHERNPQIRGDNINLNYDENIVHRWDAYGFGGGYGIRIRCRNGGCPDNLNFVGNHWTTGSASPTHALILGEDAGPDGDEALIAPEVYEGGNFMPPENLDHGTAATPFPRPPEARITEIPKARWLRDYLPHVGMPYRTAEEDLAFAEIGCQVAADVTGR